MDFKYEFKWFKDDFETDPQTRGRLFKHRSPMEESRSRWEPPTPAIFNQDIEFDFNETEPVSIDETVLNRWPELAGNNFPVILKPGLGSRPDRSEARVGIILTGEWVPASGTHNVIVGIVRQMEGRGQVLGFLGGPQGFARKHYIQLDNEKVSKYLNQGGADLLGFGSLRAIDESDFSEIFHLCTKVYKLTSLIFIGGPNELAHVSQIIYLSRRCPSGSFPTVIGVFQSPNSNVFDHTWIPVTLGYDSTRSALAEIVGNIAVEGLSSGRPSDLNIIRCGSTTITMEIALHVCPSLTILSEEIRAKNISLSEILSQIKSLPPSKSTTILMSDKFYQCLPGFAELQAECRALYVSEPMLVCGSAIDDTLYSRLTRESSILLQAFPMSQQRRIARGYDADGNQTWPDMEPERFIAYLLVKDDASIIVRSHYIGQEARCPFPTNFDCSFGLSLGRTAATLSLNPACHGYVAGVSNLVADSPADWICGGFPLSSLLSVRTEGQVTSVLTDQYGGAHQELITLAKQRTEREAGVPLIGLRPRNILEDCLYKRWSESARNKEGPPRQPGPHQFTNPLPNLALLAAYGVKDFETDHPSHLSRIERSRLEYVASGPPVGSLHISDAAVTSHRSPLNLLQLAFPRTSSIASVDITVSREAIPRSFTDLKIGIVFLGRPAAGCHNIVYGLEQSGASLIGFRNGASGLISGDYFEISQESVKNHRNLSGLDLLGRTETPIRTNSELAACVRTCRTLDLDGLAVVGGLGTHADTALLAERLPTRVIGIPASIENDIPFIEKSIGHDTACRVYASQVGSLATLAASSKRQWCFVRIAGRSLSHVIGQVAKLTHPNLVLLSEELEGWSLGDLVSLIADLITERAQKGSDFGLVLFAESVLDEIEEISRFLKEIRSGKKYPDSLSPLSRVIYESLPERNGARVIDPELLLESLVGKELQRRRIFDKKINSSFRSSTHVISHQARSSLPSRFDCDLAYASGVVAASLIAAERTGLLVAVRPHEHRAWEYGAIPLTSLLSVDFDSESLECRIEIEQRRVNVKSVFDSLPPPSARRFVCPGPIQFESEQVDVESVNVSSQLAKIQKISDLCSQIMSLGAGASEESVREVLRTGLDHTRTLVGSKKIYLSETKKTTFSKTKSSDLLRPVASSHCRVIKLIPIS
jgi:diphosphate--fructose-6-phosphate 1-phosphotransferase